MMTVQSGNANSDPAEIARFNSLAHHWWDPKGDFRPLHDMNPLRLDFIGQRATLDGCHVLDVGCGGGILSEAMAQRGAQVLGIDLAREALEVAGLHAAESKVAVEYRCVAVEELAAQQPGAYDVVTCMEMLEHVPDPAQTLAALASLVKPGGQVFVSTLNRNPKSFLFAIIGAEYVLRLLPRGTHEYVKFIRPSELVRWSRQTSLQLVDLAGVEYNPFNRSFRLSRNTAVNYLAYFRRSTHAA
jgi:2-polyprenyl-6-hydroxyphenyl methylase / 3-demethylubiquinone-9 3-methyltransferase